MSSNVGHLLLFRWVHLYIFLLVVLAYNQPVVHHSSRFYEQSTELFDILENVGSSRAFAHTDNRTFCVTSQRPLVRLIFVER